jgi:intergrase/recombinase
LVINEKEPKKKMQSIRQRTLDAYNKAFQFLTVNHGTQARKDIEVMRDEVRLIRRMFGEQQKEIAELRNLALFQEKEKKIDRTEIKRLLKELNEKDKATEQGYIHSSWHRLHTS